ncbi:MAG: reprolysin-like metallopeptidase, partial [Terriglobales bacterium]
MCLSLAGLTSRLLPVGAVAPAQPIPQSTDEIWQEITPSAEVLTESRALGLDRGRVLRLNRQALALLLSQAPREFTGAAQETEIVLPLPLPDGTLARFRIEESPAMAPELAAQYPEIKSYRGQGIDDPALTMRCDLTPQGFHALILAGGEAVNIHPVEQSDLSTYLSYSGQDLKNELQQVRCHLDEGQFDRAGEPPTAFSPQFQSGATLRTFRLAVATAQEYTNHPQLGGGTVAGTIASLNTWVNNLNVIYEAELSVHLNLVTDNRLIFTAEPDGFTNGTPGTMMREVVPKLRDVLGPNNYDVGHVLGTDSGGVAGLGVVCVNTGDSGPGKGAGASGMGGPVGNSGSLNLLAHEVGHQFGADHSFNGTLGSCNGNRSARSAWEPGSGSTIMSYAGTCNNDNTEGNQLRFHAGSLNQMLNYLGGATGASCGVRANTGNNPPNVSGGPDFTIPRNTPFTLTATGSDPDLNDLARLTYVWEQIDAGGDNFANDGSEASYSDANDPPTTTRPLFRAFAPTPSPARTFPSLTYILNNANNPPHQAGGRNTAEELPRVGRALNFRVTLRD